MDIEEIAHIVIGCAIEVHRHLGPWLLEFAYQKCLAHEINKAGLYVQEEILLPLRYKEIDLDRGLIG